MQRIVPPGVDFREALVQWWEHLYVFACVR